MFALLFGSYSIVATLPGTPLLFLLKSITRYFCLAPPPICLTVVLPELFLPPVLESFEELDGLAGFGKRNDRLLIGRSSAYVLSLSL